jgi:hypothetical protein
MGEHLIGVGRGIMLELFLVRYGISEWKGGNFDDR